VSTVVNPTSRNARVSYYKTKVLRYENLEEQGVMASACNLITRHLSWSGRELPGITQAAEETLAQRGAFARLTPGEAPWRQWEEFRWEQDLTKREQEREWSDERFDQGAKCE
jgi:hypothetical protein